MSNLIQNPFPVFTDVDGSPLEDGYIYIGVAGLNPLSNPLQAYWDSDLSVPAANIRTQNGYASYSGKPGRLYVGSNYSILVKNKNGTVIFSQLNNTDLTISDKAAWTERGLISQVGYWAKIADITLSDTGDDVSLSLKALLNIDDTDHCNAEIDVYVRKTTSASILGKVDIVSMSGASLDDDSFKLVINGYTDPVELWIQKPNNGFNQLSFFQMAMSTNNDLGTLVTYSEESPWQSAEPIGSVDNVLSTGLKYRDQIVYHEGNLTPFTADQSLDTTDTPEFKDIVLSGNSLLNIIADQSVRNWTTTSIVDSNFVGITFSESLGLFVAVGSLTPDNIAYSSDGINWTTITLTNSSFSSITFSESLGLFVAVGTSASDNIAYSSDGINWTTITSVGNIFSSVCFSESLGLFVATGGTVSGIIAYSSDGINWTVISVGGVFGGITFSESLGLFVAVGDTLPNVAYSSDGINWTTLAISDGDYKDITFSESLGLFVAVGTSASDNIAYSSDGINWTTITISDGEYNGTIFSEYLNRFVAVGTSASDNIAYSSDGINWTTITISDGNFYSVCFSKLLTRFVATGAAATNNIANSL